MGLDAKMTDILKFSLLGPFKDRVALKYMAFIFVFALIVGVVSNYLVYSVFGPFVKNPNLLADPSFATGALFQFFGFFGAIIVLYAIVLCAMQYLLMARALKILGMGSQPASATGVAKLIVTGIAHMLCALFSVFNLKMLLVGIAGVVLLIVGALMLSMMVTAPAIAFIGAVMLLVGVLALIGYVVIIIYNSVRLSVSEVALVSKGLSVADSLRLSWEKAEGNVLNIFVIGLVLSVVLSVINIVLSMPGSIYSFIVQIMGQTSLGILVDPTYAVLLVPSYMSSAFMITASVFYVTSIYANLSGEKKAGTAAPKAAPRAASKAKKKAKK